MYLYGFGDTRLNLASLLHGCENLNFVLKHGSATVIADSMPCFLITDQRYLHEINTRRLLFYLTSQAKKLHLKTNLLTSFSKMGNLKWVIKPPCVVIS